MMSQFSRCLYNRSNEKSLDLLKQTDLGFVNYGHTNLDPSKVAKIFGFHDCIGRVAQINDSGVGSFLARCT